MCSRKHTIRPETIVFRFLLIHWGHSQDFFYGGVRGWGGEGEGGDTGLNQGYTPDLSCRPPRRVLLKTNFKLVGFLTTALAAKNEVILMRFR